MRRSIECSEVITTDFGALFATGFYFAASPAGTSWLVGVSIGHGVWRRRRLRENAAPRGSGEKDGNVARCHVVGPRPESAAPWGRMRPHMDHANTAKASGRRAGGLAAIIRPFRRRRRGWGSACLRLAVFLFGTHLPCAGRGGGRRGDAVVDVARTFGVDRAPYID
jgi:hypothetical protein